MQQVELKRTLVGTLAGLVCTSWFAWGGEELDRTVIDEGPAAIPVESFNWWTGEDFSFGGIFFPHFHFIGVAGATSGNLEELALGAHDPQQEHFDLLALEPGMSMRLGNHLEGFITNSYLTDVTGDFTGGVEEAFLKLKDLPGGLELRGGRFFHRVGFQNAKHSHAWDFLDQNLVNARLLQEGELASIGGELTWHLPTRYPSALTFALGGPPSHSHGGHAHGHGDDDHGHEDAFEADDALFDDYVFSASWLATWRYNDFHQFTGTAHVSLGENGFGEDTQVYGLGLEYLWRENGLEPGGRYFRLRSEFMYRNADYSVHGEHHDEENDHHEEEGEHHEDDEDEHHDDEDEHHDEVASQSGSEEAFGFSTAATYGFNDHLEASLRAEFVQSMDDFDLDERWRVSPAVTWSLNAQKSAYLRLQYNYDHSSDFGSEHSIWLGFGINWGGSEVR